MRTSSKAAAAFALGLALTAVVAAPGIAGAPSCRGDSISVHDLASGCRVDSGVVALEDGRTFAVPAAGFTLTAAPVAEGDTDPGDVVIANRGAAGIAVQVDEVWAGSPTAVRQEHAAQQRRTLGATIRGTVSHSVATTSASCGSKAYVLTGAHWESTVRWRYNPTGARVSNVAAIQRGAEAWTGTITACGETVQSTAAQEYLGTATQQAAVTADGGCGTSNRTSVVGWGKLPSKTLALTCIWSFTGGVAFETDQRYSTSHRWASTSTCSDNRFDLRGIATHEWGHSYGLGHTAQKSALVMKPSSTGCDTAQRTLGLGDARGIAALY
ncbi:matrixin family metalloprotease [Curtobacterium sp. VKM Ac-2884]|uniref:matrixin family metalloprotease n=1 Tax=Curtobacterium sp. VKM Ac-2884 TaxID=2783818 RepID=UPI00188DA845|nr:matrixin family metalloprotease [Curtobacterium sp. VKM Ac-2884]MBF4603286.1 matrixin family metalloprotease [Curtobacterium sp. VKM Ac-2884]